MWLKNVTRKRQQKTNTLNYNIPSPEVLGKEPVRERERERVKDENKTEN